ncbi:hypothetical protein EVAR_58977_1 [Eumeta japonica]|uniref:Uncharacterized protein n=1 Tax=Eumeta variegata TaxID=151549 RepID=A0A4C1YED4_EUMVA|nr:hypothetical protein EVAR_58977_1 [Eumeta japonica]
MDEILKLIAAVRRSRHRELSVLEPAVFQLNCEFVAKDLRKCYAHGLAIKWDVSNDPDATFGLGCPRTWLQLITDVFAGGTRAAGPRRPLLRLAGVRNRPEQIDVFHAVEHDVLKRGVLVVEHAEPEDQKHRHQYKHRHYCVLNKHRPNPEVEGKCDSKATAECAARAQPGRLYIVVPLQGLRLRNALLNLRATHVAISKHLTRSHSTLGQGAVGATEDGGHQRQPTCGTDGLMHMLDAERTVRLYSGFEPVRL